MPCDLSHDHMLERQMKEQKLNKTLLRMSDEIKQDKGHLPGLDHFLQKILEKVARQAESLRTFHELVYRTSSGVFCSISVLSSDAVCV